MKTKINPTACTRQARKNAKCIVAQMKAGTTQIWKATGGFQIITGLTTSFTYTSCVFGSLEETVKHLGCRAANTGLDLQKFQALACRYARRFLTL
jgi:hypothetical protein